MTPSHERSYARSLPKNWRVLSTHCHMDLREKSTAESGHTPRSAFLVSPQQHLVRPILQSPYAQVSIWALDGRVKPEFRATRGR
jgi:hypothetical protein